jgi:uncharacterized membrane protein
MAPMFETKDPPPPRHSGVRRALRYFFAGVGALVPIGGTLWVLLLIYQALLRVGDFLIDDCVFGSLNWLRGVKDGDAMWRFDFPGANLVRFAVPVAIILGMGFAVTHAPGRRALSWLNKAITRIPVLGFIYAAIKQFVDALHNLGGPRKFKSVAYVDYPAPGCRLIGFVTGACRDPDTGAPKTAIFIPTSPNPLTGFTLLVDDERVINSSITLEEASKLIISAGLVLPRDPKSAAADEN